MKIGRELFYIWLFLAFIDITAYGIQYIWDWPRYIDFHDYGVGILAVYIYFKFFRSNETNQKET